LSRRKTTSEFIMESLEVHGNRYNYDQVDYKANNIKVAILCLKHGVFYIRPSDHLRGQGCNVCGGTKRKSTCDFVNDAKLVHGNRYDYSLVDYKNNRTKVMIKCFDHGVFNQNPDDHLRGNGCPQCANNVRLTKEEFIAKSNLIHNNSYDYSLVKYINNSTKVDIVCLKHGVFSQTPGNHLSGKGCRKCSMEFDDDFIKEINRKRHSTMKANGSYSKSNQEDLIYDLLCEKFGSDDIVRQYESKLYPFKCDFYVKSLDLYIEYNGHWTHNNHFYDKNNKIDIDELNRWIEKSKYSKYYEIAVKVWSQRDVLKNETAISNNINYIVFWDYNLLDFKKWISEV